MDLTQALSFSRYAQRMIAFRPEYRDTWHAAPDSPLDWRRIVDEPIRRAMDGDDGEALAATLRQARQHVMLHTLARDLLGIADLDEVCGAMGRLAETTLAAALEFHRRQWLETRGTPRGGDSHEAQTLVVVAMGKLGGNELNVSSDIDLVFLYPEDGETDGARPLSNHEFFVRLGQRLIAALNDVTADGFVFRVDMRLRPYGNAGPLAVSFDSLEQYLTAQGRMWERYAWLKARPLTGDRHDELARLITPFVYRKYLDFDAYEGLRDIREQIREQGRTRDYARNVKLGSGGIRDIEFVAQALQIVRGGRLPELQLRGTREALRALGERDLLHGDAVAELLDAYDFLRRVEHRLQYREDQATQTLPEDGEAHQALAHSMAFASAAAFDAALDAHRRNVCRHFDTLLGYDVPVAVASAAHPASPPHGDSPAAPGASRGISLTGESIRQALVAQRFADPIALADRVVRSRAGRRYAQLPERSQQRFDALTRRLIDVAAHAACGSDAGGDRQTGIQSDALFLRLFDLLETVSRRSAYLALLSEHPQVLPMLARLLGASSWAADYLNRHPILLDELLAPRVLLAEPDWLAWRDELSRTLRAHAGDAERQIDELRHFQHAQTFRLLAQDLAGQLTVERLADHLTALADLILELTLEYCWAALAPGLPPPCFAVIGYGKLGSKEMSYGSDLDLVFIYDCPDGDDGDIERYTRLVQRMNTWLTSTTAAGSLYSTDLRLRPDGGSGLFVSRWDAFVRYQREKAWTFEHQALTRARFIAGSGELGAAFMRERADLLQRPRDIATLRRDIAAMRQRIRDSRPPQAADFDIKYGDGGMIDIEFIVQFLVLANAHRYPTLTRNTGNVALLTAAASLELITAAEAEAAAQAYRTYRRLQHAAQLQGAEAARIDPARCEKERAAIDALRTRLLADGAVPPGG